MLTFGNDVSTCHHCIFPMHIQTCPLEVVVFWSFPSIATLCDHWPAGRSALTSLYIYLLWKGLGGCHSFTSIMFYIETMPLFRKDAIASQHFGVHTVLSNFIFSLVLIECEGRNYLLRFERLAHYLALFRCLIHIAAFTQWIFYFS